MVDLPWGSDWMPEEVEMTHQGWTGSSEGGWAPSQHGGGIGMPPPSSKRSGKKRKGKEKQGFFGSLVGSTRRKILSSWSLPRRGGLGGGIVFFSSALKPLNPYFLKKTIPAKFPNSSKKEIAKKANSRENSDSAHRWNILYPTELEENGLFWIKDFLGFFLILVFLILILILLDSVMALWEKSLIFFETP